MPELTTWIGVIGAAVSAVGGAATAFIHGHHKARIAAITKGGPEAARIVADAVAIYDLDTSKLTNRQVVELALNEIASRDTRNRRTFLLLCGVLVAFLVVAVVGILKRSTDEPKPANLKISADGPGSIAVTSPTGSRGSVREETSFSANQYEEWSLSPIPSKGGRFVGWTGPCGAAQGTNCTVRPSSANVSIQARFEAIRTITFEAPFKATIAIDQGADETCDARCTRLVSDEGHVLRIVAPAHACLVGCDDYKGGCSIAPGNADRSLTIQPQRTIVQQAQCHFERQSHSPGRERCSCTCIGKPPAEMFVPLGSTQCEPMKQACCSSGQCASPSLLAPCPSQTTLTRVTPT